jgi:predicted peroxiredoxin
MSIEEITKVLGGQIICADNSAGWNVERAFASDLMSDVLTLNTDSLMLVTGLANMQTIRTAEMAEIKIILFVRNKKPSEEMIQLAKQEGINLLFCNKSMFAACGELFKLGLSPVY